MCLCAGLHLQWRQERGGKTLLHEGQTYRVNFLNSFNLSHQDERPLSHTLRHVLILSIQQFIEEYRLWHENTPWGQPMSCISPWPFWGRVRAPAGASDWPVCGGGRRCWRAASRTRCRWCHSWRMRTRGRSQALNGTLIHTRTCSLETKKERLFPGPSFLKLPYLHYYLTCPVHNLYHYTPWDQ